MLGGSGELSLTWVVVTSVSCFALFIDHIAAATGEPSVIQGGYGVSVKSDRTVVDCSRISTQECSRVWGSEESGRNVVG